MTSLPDRKLTSRPFHLPRGLRGVQAVAQDAASRSCKADRCQARWGWWDASVKTKHHLRKRTLFDCRRRRPGQEIDAVQRRRALGSPRACSLSSFAERLSGQRAERGREASPEGIHFQDYCNVNASGQSDLKLAVDPRWLVVLL